MDNSEIAARIAEIKSETMDIAKDWRTWTKEDLAVMLLQLRDTVETLAQEINAEAESE